MEMRRLASRASNLRWRLGLKNVVGFDIVELCPNEVDKSSDFLAAKLYYKMLSYKFESTEKESEFEEDMDIDDRKGNSNRIFEEDDY